MMVKKQIAGVVGEFENRFYGVMVEFDWVFRAEQQGFKVSGKSAGELEKVTGLQAYFWGRNPWFMIKLRLKGKWWIKKGRKIRSYWLKKLGIIVYQGSGKHLKSFFSGTIDGWRIMLNKN
jgi:hypothetical protein